MADTAAQYAPKLPPVVQKQAAAANAHFAKAQQPPEAPASEAAAPSGAPPDSPTLQPSAAPAQTPTASPALTPPADDVAQLKAQVAMLERMLAQGGQPQGAQVQQPPKQEPPQPAATSLPIFVAPKFDAQFSDEDARQIDDEYGRALQGWVRAEIAKALKPYTSALDQVANKMLPQIDRDLRQTQSTTQSNVQRAMLEVLSQQVPNWREINGDPEKRTPGMPQWFDFLDTREHFSGRTFQELLDDAQQAGDGYRVAHIFKQFLNNQAHPTPQVSAGPAPQQAPAVQAQPGLEQWVAPGTQAATPVPTDAASGREQVQPITQKEIAAFYAAKLRGDYDNHPEKARQIEAKIFAAIGKGRVRG